MGKVLVITNRKGGCGKSVTTASLGVGLARQGNPQLSATRAEVAQMFKNFLQFVV